MNWTKLLAAQVASEDAGGAGLIAVCERASLGGTPAAGTKGTGS